MIQFKTIAAAVVLFACLGLSACRSAYVETVIMNHTGKTAHLVEVDYPGGSFGTQQIATDAVYRYRFKVLESAGPVKITYTEGAGKVHTATGPVLELGQRGRLTITIGADGGVTWHPQLTTPN